MDNKNIKEIIINSVNPLKFDFSAIILVISNIIVIALAVIFKWNLMHLLWVYLGQNFIVGIFAFIRLLSVKNPMQMQVKVTTFEKTEYKKINKYYMAFLFLFHYGFFNIMYFIGLSLISSFATEVTDLESKAIIPGYLGLAFLIFFANHLFSFIYNFKKERESKTNLQVMMFLPYLRILPMHLLPFVAGIFLGNFLITFMVLKTIVDVITHNINHNIILQNQSHF